MSNNEVNNFIDLFIYRMFLQLQQQQQQQQVTMMQQHMMGMMSLLQQNLEH